MTDPTQRPMRRSNRAMPEHLAWELINNAAHGTLSLSSPDGWPYATPLSHVTLDGHLYFHCAKEGLRCDLIAQNNRVCFSFIGQDKPAFIDSPANFTTRYASALAFGRAYLVTDDAEKNRALTALCQKTLPDFSGRIDEAIARAAAVTAVYRVEVDRVTGKTNA